MIWTLFTFSRVGGLVFNITVGDGIDPVRDGAQWEVLRFLGHCSQKGLQKFMWGPLVFLTRRQV
jgi:hypothetical protein